MAAISKRSWDAVPHEMMRTLFFNNTTSDYAGKAVAPGSRTENFTAVRERQPRAGIQILEPRRGSSVSSSSGSSAPSMSATVPAKQSWQNLTAYTQNFNQKPLDGLGMDRELASKLRDMAQGCGLVKVRGDYVSCYGGMCLDRSRGNVPQSEPFVEEDNDLGNLISPCADIVGCPKLSFASTQHRAPARELLLSTDSWEPRGQIGSLPKAADFFQTESQRQFRHPAGAPPPRRASSEPGLALGVRAAAVEQNPDRALRQAMMTSQYKLAFTASPVRGTRRHGGH